MTNAESFTVVDSRGGQFEVFASSATGFGGQWTFYTQSGDAVATFVNPCAILKDPQNNLREALRKASIDYEAYCRWTANQLSADSKFASDLRLVISSFKAL